MSDSATAVLQRLNKTPLRDLVRGKITGRLDWKRRLAAASLPDVATSFIARVVKRSRLFRLEKAAVADELLAYFRAGLAAGSDVVELVERLGDDRTGRRLIRNGTARLATPSLPVTAADLIDRVVKRTRLFRYERAAVADELVAHFLDGLAAGSTEAELVERFGDERVAARLIRWAKRRGRALPWRVCSAGIRAVAVLLAVYVILLLRFCLGRPIPAVDYLAKVNEPIRQTPQGDRAWPLWRQAILASSDGMVSGQRSFPEAITTDTNFPWQGTVKWLNGHASAVELAQAASRKPVLGFVLGPGGSEDDPELFSWGGHPPTGGTFASILLPHLTDLSNMGRVLSLDARRAAEKGDGPIAEADIMSLLGLARQLRESDGLVVTEEVALQVNDIALDRLRLILFNYPVSLRDEALTRLAHAISGPEAAADLVNAKRERYLFTDIVQRLYTDDGHGNGHLTLSGLRALPMLLAPMATDKDGVSHIDLAFDAASTVPLLTASRAELMAEYDRLTGEEEADFHLPMRQVGAHTLQWRLKALKKSPVDRFRYAILFALDPGISRSVEASCEIYLGKRDGILVGIALELYRRRHGKYPAALAELTPEFLPGVPADRITGEPVKYRLIDGKPVVYSVGADRIDDGGRSPDGAEMYYRSPAAAWGEAPAKAPRGDWLLFAPEPSEDGQQTP